MSLQQDLDKVDSEIDKIRFDPKYLQLKNKKRSDFDTNHYTRYTRQLKRLDVQKKDIEQKMRNAGLKPLKRETGPSQHVESKPAWRNQKQNIARRNQDAGTISRNWVKDRKEAKEVASEFPGKRNAVDAAKPEPDSVTVNPRKTVKTPARLFVKKMLYRKPVKRNASQMARLKEEGRLRIERRMHPVNETVRAKPRLKKSDDAEKVKPARGKKQPRKTADLKKTQNSDSSEDDMLKSVDDDSGDLIDDLSN